MIASLISSGLQADETPYKAADSSQIATETAVIAQTEQNATVIGAEVVAITQIEQNTTVPESESYENYTEKKTASVEQPKSGDSFGRKVLVVAAAPVVVIGFIISAIVLAPVWLVKKVFGKDK